MALSGCQLISARAVRTATETVPVLQYRVFSKRPEAVRLAMKGIFS
jgi:hypothetical protein